MKWVLTLAAGLGLIAFVGCRNDATPTSESAKPAAADHADGHSHKPGQFGGAIVPIGNDSYHAETVFEKGGTLRLYTLGRDEAKVLEVEAQTLSAFAKLAGGTEAVPFELKPKPQPGDKPGMTSLFIGTLPELVRGKAVEVTVVNLRIGTERFRLAFASAAEAGHADMPAKVADDEERTLYLTPGGKYTPADIAANGNTTASLKFKGLKSAHDDQPRPGDQLCPISKTKAVPRFSWVVGGKTYQFCCPPCVDEFLQTAKEKPDEVKDPAEYVKK